MRKLFFLFLLIIFLFMSRASATQEPSQPVVHAILFYSPSCGHCYQVITSDLPPLIEKYGEQLLIVGVDVTTTGGQELFTKALQYFDLESGGVPFLVIGDTYLIGSVDIPEKLPGLIEHYLARGGLDWPTIPGLAEIIIQAQTTQTPTPQSTTPSPTIQTIPQAGLIVETSTPLPTNIAATPTSIGLIVNHHMSRSVWERFAVDPLGNGFSTLVLAGMVVTFIYASINLFVSSKTTRNKSWSRLIPVLCVIGLAVAGYLSYVETTQVEAVCGPVGDCNTVQHSEYARLFGVLPIGVLGVGGYIIILLAWIVGVRSDKRQAAYASLAILVITSFGVLFSIYLTYIEPFIIGATCAWCLSSGIIMTVLFWLSLVPGKAAFLYLYHGEKNGIKRSNSSRAF
jgi:uncharacterized membrane protein/thiol-disulfide isomerase/thioredoxin